MKVLITGCQGFIGKNLATHLKKQGHHVVGIDKKLKVGDPVFVDEFVGHDMESRITIENDFDKVYHLSADVPNSKNVGSAQLGTGRSNPIQTIQAMDFAAKNKSHFIFESVLQFDWGRSKIEIARSRALQRRDSSVSWSLMSSTFGHSK